MRKLYEELSEKYNIVVVSDKVYNVRLNNVIYINLSNDTIVHKVLKKLNIKKVIINNFSYFLYGETIDIKIYYIHNKINFFQKYKNTLYYNNGISIIKNYIHNIENLLFFSKNEINNFKLFYGIEKMNNFKLTSFNLDNIKPDKKEKFIISYDKHIEELLLFFKIFNKLNGGDYKLVLFNDDIRIKDENIIYYPRNYHCFIKNLKKSKLFITMENKNYTYYNILLSLKCNCISLVPKYFIDFKDECILYNIIDTNIFNKIKEKMNKKVIYKNLNKFFKNKLNL